ncbi:STAS domain-containing protein [Celerinatantimonas yamalensis]|uniref:Phospholipid transport system transporter-binding protein n=1 Tax=Celerinatantimonas yamalensis TaxID=559956 RepID=A0ABW9GAU1_9GAMM
MANSGFFECKSDGVIAFQGDWTMAMIADIWPQLLAQKFECADFSQISQIDSAGLAAIITALMKNQQATTINIRHCPDSIRPLIALYGLEPYLAHSS